MPPNPPPPPPRPEGHRTDNNYTRRRSRSRSRSPTRETYNARTYRFSPKKPYDVKIPDTFKACEDFIDSNEVWKMPLPRFVEKSEWTSKQTLAGMDLCKVPVYKVINNGIASYAMRLLGNGRYVQFEACRSFRESCFIQAILTELRAKESENSLTYKIDLDSIAESIAKEKGWSFKIGTDKKKAYAEVALRVSDYLQTMAPVNNSASILKEMEDLKKENARLKNAQMKAPSTSKASSSKDQPGKPLPAESSSEEEVDPGDQEESQKKKPKNLKSQKKAEQTIPEMDFTTFDKTALQEPWLGSHFPKSTAKKDIIKFIKDSIAALKNKDKVKFDKLHEALQTAWDSATNPEKATIQDKAYIWGLSMNKIVNSTNEQIIVMIALAKYHN